jgi:hypothetical protein
MYPTNEIKKEKLIVVLVSGLIAMTASYFGMTAQFSPSLADASSFMTTLVLSMIFIIVTLLAYVTRRILLFA